jgi:hypothetical protein
MAVAHGVEGWAGSAEVAIGLSVDVASRGAETEFHDGAIVIDPTAS